eukprot:s4048_g4.t1
MKIAWSFSTLLILSECQNLQPSSDCLSSCPGLENATSAMNDASAGMGPNNFGSTMRTMISTMCQYQSDFACMMQSCAPDGAVTAGDILKLLDCLCTDCPAYGAVFANMPGFVSLMLSGNADSSSLTREMCSYVGPLNCLEASSSCSNHSSDDSNGNAAFFAQISAMEPNCTDMGLFTGVNDALTTTTLNGTIKDDAVEHSTPSFMLQLCVLFLPFGLHPEAYFNSTGQAIFQQQLYQCMLSQTLILKSDIETRRSYNQFGTLVWQLNEIWPTGGWGFWAGDLKMGMYGSPVKGQVLGGRWKPLHYLYRPGWRRSIFADVMATCGANGTCYVKNDGAVPFEGHCNVSTLCHGGVIRRFVDGQRQLVKSLDLKMAPGPGTKQIFQVKLDDHPGSFMLLSECLRSSPRKYDLQTGAFGALHANSVSFNEILMAAPFQLDLPGAKDLCKDLPHQFEEYLTYCRKLQFEERPDYGYLRQLLRDAFAKEGFQLDFVYDWSLVGKLKTDPPAKSHRCEQRDNKRRPRGRTHHKNHEEHHQELPPEATTGLTGLAEQTELDAMGKALLAPAADNDRLACMLETGGRQDACKGPPTIPCGGLAVGGGDAVCIDGFFKCIGIFLKDSCQSTDPFSAATTICLHLTDMYVFQSISIPVSKAKEGLSREN